MLLQKINFNDIISSSELLFNNFENRWFGGEKMADLRVKNKGNEVYIDLPGVGKDNIKVESVSQDTIKIQWTEKAGEKDTTEFINLNVVPHNDAKASYVDGVLKITLIDDKVKKTITVE